MKDPIQQAADELDRQRVALEQPDESEYDYGYRCAYERITQWLRHEFQPEAPLTVAATPSV